MESERDATGHTPEDEAPERDGQPEHAGQFDQPDDDDGQSLDAAGGNTALPPKLEAWRRRSAAGAILTGFALGLQEALETRKDEPSIVMETSGEPPKDLPVEADFEYGRPRQSTVQIRPWLLPDAGSGTANAGGSSDDEDKPAGGR